MTDNDPNYRQLSPPEDKMPEEYSYVERRAEIFDMIEEAGHYRNLERSQRNLARRYDVSQTTIHRDINTINEWMAERIGTQAEAELEMLKSTAIQKLLEAGEFAKAYHLMAEHYDILMDAGEKDRAPTEHEVDQTTRVEGSIDVDEEDIEFFDRVFGQDADDSTTVQ